MLRFYDLFPHSTWEHNTWPRRETEQLTKRVEGTLTPTLSQREREHYFAMSQKLPEVYLARHGEPAWSLSGQHTGLTDLPLTERGELNAQSLGRRLHGSTFAKVLTSPLK